MSSAALTKCSIAYCMFRNTPHPNANIHVDHVAAAAGAVTNVTNTNVTPLPSSSSHRNSRTFEEALNRFIIRGMGIIH